MQNLQTPHQAVEAADHVIAGRKPGDALPHGLDDAPRSWPRTQGVGKGMLPSITWRSLWQTPDAAVFISTSPGAGSSISTSSISRGRCSLASVQPSRCLSLASGLGALSDHHPRTRRCSLADFEGRDAVQVFMTCANFWVLVQGAMANPQLPMITVVAPLPGSGRGPAATT